LPCPLRFEKNQQSQRPLLTHTKKIIRGLKITGDKIRSFPNLRNRKKKKRSSKKSGSDAADKKEICRRRIVEQCSRTKGSNTGRPIGLEVNSGPGNRRGPWYELILWQKVEPTEEDVQKQVRETF